MLCELTATTEPGRRLAALAGDLAQELASNAAQHDRDGTYPYESVRAVQASGYYAAPVPKRLGGFGVHSTRDLIVASTRLAQGDASVAIGVNMHLAVLGNIARLWRRADAAGDDRRAKALAGPLVAVVRDGMVIAAAISEPGQDITRPGTKATRTDRGWRIDGRKIFCTGSPSATVLYASVSYVDGEGTERYGYAPVPVDAPGVVLHDDWDALGMRGSGSQSVSFEGVELPAPAIRGGFPAGDAKGYMERNLPAGLFHASASLGIAEGANQAANAALARRGEPDARSRTLVSENAVDLVAARACLSRTAELLDDDSYGDCDVEGLFAEAQAAKLFVNDAASRVVDRALVLSGGSGYLSASPLARAYRDVKAAAFMNPLASNRAYEFLADVSLGRETALH